MKIERVKSQKCLKEQIIATNQILFTGHKTSTVIPYENLKTPSTLKMIDLSSLPPMLTWSDNDTVIVEGAVTWEMLRDFTGMKNRDIPIFPTETEAVVLSGIATSCSGENSFYYGSFRDYVTEINYLDHNGDQKCLLSKNKLSKSHIFQHHSQLLKLYQEDYQDFEGFKNGPMPRLSKETDLMFGTEGQLGAIVSATLNTVPLENCSCFFKILPRWEDDFSEHLRILDKLVLNEDLDLKILELIDSNSLKFLTSEKQKPFIDPETQVLGDILLFKVPVKNLSCFENLFCEEENIFEMRSAFYNDFRVSVPQMINEVNLKNKAIKKGTDVQVSREDFALLLESYREFSKEGIPYFLFGHFGDRHLHFNFTPKLKEEVLQVEELLTEFYKGLTKLKVSPFAEHGIGIVKYQFVKHFWGANQMKMFKFLKEKFDPQNKFFPMGYMGKIINE
jgi:FAD/FMN-containing dehydrogenase